MKIAIITDIHFAGAPTDAFDARAIVAQFVALAIGQEVDLLVDMGDRIDDSDREADLDNAAALAQIFGRFPGRRLHLLGNHDVVNLTGDDHLKLFGRAPGHQAMNFEQLRVIAWEPSVRLDRRHGFTASASDLDWLVATLAADPRPAIIFSHIPVSGAAMTGNYYFENNSDLATYPNHAEIRRAVEATGQAALWVSGHVHWNSTSVVGNLRHLTIQSVSERFTTMPERASTRALLTISGETMHLEVVGNDPLQLEVPFGGSGRRRWPEPRPRVPRH